MTALGVTSLGSGGAKVFNVRTYGATGDGSTDDSAAFNAASAAAEVEGGIIHIPPTSSSYLLSSQWEIDCTVGASNGKTIMVSGYGARITTSGAISALRITGGGNLGGVHVYGLYIQHRGNANATAGIVFRQAGNSSANECIVQHGNGNASGYACFLVQNSNDADADTGSFWTEINRCLTRKISGSDSTDTSYGVILEGTANATVIRGCKFNNHGGAGVLLRRQGSGTLRPDSPLITENSFENCHWSVLIDGASAVQQINGLRIINNRHESSGIAYTITGATQANPVVITAVGHDFANGEQVYIDGVGGMTEINNRRFTVAGVSGNTFQLSGEDGTGHTAYTTGGTVRDGGFFRITGTTGDTSGLYPYIAGNFYAHSIATYISNTDSRKLVNLDAASVTPDFYDSQMRIWGPVEITCLGDAAALPFDVRAGGGGRGIRVLTNSGGQSIQMNWTGSGTGTGQIRGSGTNQLYLDGIRGISHTTTGAQNLSGQVTFATAATATVTFGTAEASTSYHVILGPQANETFWVSGIGTGGFTINSSNASSTAVVDWMIIKYG